MAFFIPSAAAQNSPTRRERIASHYRDADPALRRIEASSNNLKYGSKIKLFLNNYRFPSVAHVYEYFQVYLSELTGSTATVDNELLETCVINTFNCIPDDAVDDEHTNDRAFQAIFEELYRQISLNSDHRVATANFLIGPTGSGKTAFSKALFTVCLRRFWDRNIVPCGVEYSRFISSLTDSPIGHVTDREFFDFVRRCQLRDLLIYLCISGFVSQDQGRNAISLLKSPSAYRILNDLMQKNDAVRFDGDEFSLDSATRNTFTSAVKAFSSTDCNDVLYELSTILDVKFLVSFDGFDSTRIEHFLFERGQNLPIYYLVRLLKGIHEKAVTSESLGLQPECHYLAYLRDTTFNHLQMELMTGVGSKKEYPCYWIVPPRYDQMVDNAAQFITGTEKSEDNLGERFSEDISSTFDRVLFGGTQMSASTHMSFVFGSSGRRMKRHIS